MKAKIKTTIITAITAITVQLSMSQTAVISGKIISEGKPVENASITLLQTSEGSVSDTFGLYRINNLSTGIYKVEVTCVGFNKMEKTVSVKENNISTVNFDLTNLQNSLNEVVVTGTLKEVRRLESPVAVEVYTPTYFKKNPTPNIYEALQNVNGVRPQLNCNVCNTGDIHINGLEGPYTMVLIDGMPIVSSLSTVY
ncbi:MAG: carboxypeptidase-like regulatory domain-containing protein, partial [Ferruginibacter sp.]